MNMLMHTNNNWTAKEQNIVNKVRKAKDNAQTDSKKTAVLQRNMWYIRRFNIKVFLLSWTSTILAERNKQYCYSDNRMNHNTVLTYFTNLLKARSNSTSVSPACHWVTPAYKVCNLLTKLLNILMFYTLWMSEFLCLFRGWKLLFPRWNLKNNTLNNKISITEKAT